VISQARDKQFESKERVLKSKRGIKAKMDITAEYLANPEIDNRHKRTIRRAAANGFFPSIAKDDTYNAPTCKNCFAADEDNTHFLLECQAT